MITTLYPRRTLPRTSSPRSFGPLAKSLRSLVVHAALCLTLPVALLSAPAAGAQTPAIGAQAPDFTLSTPTGTSVSLGGELKQGKVVLVLLRGFPGYQCPYCTRQVHDFIDHAQEFAARKVKVLFVYPGPPAELDQRAKEFLAKQADLPPGIQLVIDPDYSMTNKYGLRWDAPHETAYPSTFILDHTGKVLFEKTSHGHGDRTSAQDVLDNLGPS